MRTARDFSELKRRGEKSVVVTAYDASFAALACRAGVDAILVGDSLGMVVQGHLNTLAVTLDQMIYHCASVVRGRDTVRHANAASATENHPLPHIIADLPFGSYQAGDDNAVHSAVRLCAEGGAESVKLEGGRAYVGTVERILRAGIPVMGHIGLTPQSVHAFGGFKVQGREQRGAEQIVDDARALEQAGAFALVLEGIPVAVAAKVRESVKLPTIGIGAGVGCDGQVLVITDLLGLGVGLSLQTPRFVKRFAELGDTAQAALARYADEVRRGLFPGDDQSFL